MTGVKRGSLQSPLPNKDSSLGTSSLGQIHTLVPVHHGSELCLAALNQMQVSSFLVEKRKHPIWMGEDALLCLI